MDDLTRERFWPKPLPIPLPPDNFDEIAARRAILVGADTDLIERRRHARLRAVKLKAELRLIAAMRRTHKLSTDVSTGVSARHGLMLSPPKRGVSL